MWASVVLPVPAGPHSTIDGNCPEDASADNGFPGPNRCRCPTTSSNVRGRIRVASGSLLMPL